MPIFIEAGFWEFSTLLYSKKGSKNSFLWLQDNLHLNINLLLFTMYLVDEGYLITEDQLLLLNACLAESESETDALRLKRRDIGRIAKDSAHYKEALQLELDAEKAQQSVLIDNVNILTGLYELKTKPPQQAIQEHLQMLFYRLSKEKNSAEYLDSMRESNYHSQMVINDYLTNA